MTNLSEADVTLAFRGQPHRRLAIGGSDIAYWRFGNGPDVVLVHGWPLHSATFRRIIPILARSFTLHAFDLPGTGQTIAGEGSSSHLLAHAETVKKIVDSLELSRYGVIAHDTGAAIARFAVAGDPRLAGLVMGNTEIPGHRPDGIELMMSASRLPGFSSFARAALRVPMIRRSSRTFGGCFTDANYADGEFGELFIEPFIQSQEVARGQMQLVKEFDLSLFDDLEACHRDIRVPTRCIWGPNDPFFPIDKARGMLHQFAGGAGLVEIPGGKLFSHEDHPVEFAGHAGTFLSRCFSRTTAPIAMSA